jgi:hypothetical protein
MPKITLTDLIDVVSKSGPQKATKVAQVKNRPAYTPASDFYKIFREGVIDIHRTGAEKSEVRKISAKTSDLKRITHYAGMASGYAKWWGKKNISWFTPPSETYSNAGIDVSINPELGLIVNGKSHVVKLYMKSDVLTKNRADLITALMEYSLRDEASDDTVMAVLDVKRSKIYEYSRSDRKFRPMIDAELAYIASIWPHI